MKITVVTTTRASRDVRDAITDAFTTEGLEIDDWRQPKVRYKVRSFDPEFMSLDPDFISLAVTFVLGATAGGLIYDAEKVILHKGLVALQSIIQKYKTGTTITIKPAGNEPVDYEVPKGKEGDLALAVIEADYEANFAKGGQRVWRSGEGWIGRG